MKNKTFLLDEYRLSKWAYLYCKNVNDDPEVRKHITDYVFAYCYCKNIKDDPEVRKYINYQRI